ncbi:MAG TPA: flagellar hook-associated protein FlgK [Clostridia bacterium]|nr:flagellar hook-associated protein FlgK [Clostridia bacterium]
MESTFRALQVARSALNAHRKAMDVAAHNVANASTEGYSRQQVVLTATSSSSPYYTGQTGITYAGYGAQDATKGAIGYLLGTGVTVHTITRMRDAYLDLQVRNESTRWGYWKTRSQGLMQVEVIFNEPSESGLASIMNRFWDAFELLAANPESSAARNTVIAEATSLSEAFQDASRKLDDLAGSMDKALEARASEITSLARQIAHLNDEIAGLAGTGAEPGDLLDRRDLALDRLSELGDIEVYNDHSGGVSVMFGGIDLVRGTDWREIRYVSPGYGVRMEEGPVFGPGGPYFVVGAGGSFDGGLVAAEGNTLVPVRVNGGETKAYLDMRKDYLPKIAEDLDALADALRSRVNEVHRAGYGLDGVSGRQFFADGSGARDLRLHDDVALSPEKIAASLSGAVGDGSNALSLAAIRREAVCQGATPGDFYNSIVTGLGVAGHEAKRMSENQEVLRSHVLDQRSGANGVSLDEEMVEIIKSEHAYQAAARVVTSVDEMVSTIIDRMGLVGR